MAKPYDNSKLKINNSKLTAGIDEAGRGPLAGPVVAAAVILSADHTIIGINDSKKLSPKKREELYELIMAQAQVGVGIVSESVIDEINILQATFRAMREAVLCLPVKPDKLLVDGNSKIPDCPYDQEVIVQGDSKVESIGAASIIAKVTRDRMMLVLHEEYPHYNFATHKGYGTKVHIEAIKKYGPSPIHRRSFIKNFV